MEVIVKLGLTGLLALTTTCALAQSRLSFDFGAYGGRPLAPVLKIQGNQYSGLFGERQFIHDPGYTYGPTFSVNLTNRLAAQFDALYKPLRFDTIQSNFASYGNTSTLADWWEFPLTGKWYLGSGEIRPFVQGGVSFNSVAGTTTGYSLNLLNGKENRSSQSFKLSNSPTGFVAGAGFHFKAWKMHLAPVVRYTHWTPAISEAGYWAEPNQLDVLIGLTFRIGNRVP